MLVAIVLGGLASIVGTVFGALFMAFQNEIVDAISGLIPSIDILKGYLPTTKSDFERLRVAVYSVPLIIFIIFAPGGLAGLVRQVGNSAPTWWQGARLRVTGWASLAGLAGGPPRGGGPSPPGRPPVGGGAPTGGLPPRRPTTRRRRSKTELGSARSEGLTARHHRQGGEQQWYHDSDADSFSQACSSL